MTRGQLAIATAYGGLRKDLFWAFSSYRSFDDEPTGQDAKRENIAVVASLGWKLLLAGPACNGTKVPLSLGPVVAKNGRLCGMQR